MNRSRASLIVVCVGGWFAGVGGLLAVNGCGSGSGPAIVPQSSNQQQNVMVIDEGIDLSASDLQGKVSAAYTETCVDQPASDAGSPTGDGGAVSSGAAFDALKQMFLAELAQPDDSCHLTSGISAKANPLPTIAKFEARWNAMVRANQTPSEVFNSAEIRQLMGPIDTEFSSFGYHGTATSTTVAHANPSVRLVLVERELGSESSLQMNFPCIAQSDIDQFVDLLNDSQVYTAFVNQPATVDGELAAAQAKYDVGIVNESFGAESRQTLEMLQSQYCATPVDLSAYFTLLDQATIDHNATLTGPAVLTVQAAGNDGVQIDTGADSLSCDLGDPKALLVGAYNPGTLAQNTFSNYGACVNLYAPGQAIVVEYAGGWLTWGDGTSFSSPLTVRYASMSKDMPAPFAPDTARTAVLAAIQPSNQFLPVGLFPTDFFYTPQQTTTDFAVPLANPKAAAARRPPSKYELHRVLGPLNRLKRLLGR
jgi:hypothetical protein